jgi:hypothetical protein
MLDFRQWDFPPYKQHYANDLFDFEKPPLIISNKYAVEWGQGPVNYFDIPTLRRLFELLGDDYTLIYKRPKPDQYAIDENEAIPVGDIQAGVLTTDYILCHEYGVYHFEEVRGMAPAEWTYNEFQFHLFAACDRYISVQGGNSHICSAFGKTNINYVREGKEARPGYFDPGKWYHRMNGCDTRLARTYDDVLSLAKDLYL